MSETRTLKVVVVGNAKQASAALKQLSGDVEGVGSKTRRVGTGFAGTMAKMGKAAALGFGVSAGAAAAFTYKVGAPYEQTLNRIGALNKLNAQQQQIVAKKIESGAAQYAKLGATVGDAADGVMELNKAGLSLDQSLRAVNATMVLAKAGNMSVADSASLVANTLNTFKLNADQAGHVANSLANAANASSADVGDMREALAMAGLAAKQAGLDIDQTNAYLAILHNNGLKGSDAGTSLKTMFLRLTSGADPVNKALKGIGVSVFDNKGRMRDLNQVVKDFLPALDKLSDEKRAKALYKIFGSDSIRSANAIFGEGSKSIDEMMGKIKEAGTAQRFAEASTKGLSGTVAKLKANFVSFGQVTYRAFAPLANELLAPVNDALAGLIPKIMPASKALTHMVQSLKGGGGPGGNIGKTFATLKKFGVALLPTLKQLAQQFMSALKPAIHDIAHLFNDTLLPAFNDFLPAITPVVKFLLKIVGGALIGVFKGAVDVIKGALKILAGVMNVITGLLTGDWSKAWEGVKQILGGALQAIWGLIQVWWNGSILGVFKRFPLMLKGLVKKGWTSVVGLFKSGTKLVEGILKRAISLWTLPYRLAFRAAVNYVKTGWRFIRGDFTKGVGGVRAIIGRIVQVITYPYRQAFTLAKGIVKNGMSAVRNGIARGKALIQASMAKIKSAIVDPIRALPGRFIQFGKWIIEGLVKGITSVKDLPGKALNKIGGGLKKGFGKVVGLGSPSRIFKQYGKWIIEGLVNGLRHSTSVEKAAKAIRNLGQLLMRAFNAGKISRASKDAMIELLRKQEKEIFALVKRRLALTSKLAKAQKELNRRQKVLADLREARDTVRDSATSAARDKGGFLGTLAQDGEQNTVAAIMSRFAGRLKAIQSFRANFNTLRQRHLSADLLSQIAAAGPDEGGLMAQALLKASGAQLQQLNSIGSSIDFESRALGANAGSVYDARIEAARQGVVAQQKNVVNVKVIVQGNVRAENELVAAISKGVREEIERINKRNGK